MAFAKLVIPAKEAEALRSSALLHRLDLGLCDAFPAGPLVARRMMVERFAQRSLPDTSERSSRRAPGPQPDRPGPGRWSHREAIFGQRPRRHNGQPRAPVVEVSLETPEYDLTRSAAASVQLPGPGWVRRVPARSGWRPPACLAVRLAATPPSATASTWCPAGSRCPPGFTQRPVPARRILLPAGASLEFRAWPRSQFTPIQCGRIRAICSSITASGIHRQGCRDVGRPHVPR